MAKNFGFTHVIMMIALTCVLYQFFKILLFADADKTQSFGIYCLLFLVIGYLSGNIEYTHNEINK